MTQVDFNTQIKNLPLVVAGTYNFLPLSPGGTLTSGITNTITLSPVPLGVNGNDVGHYLYISGGTGTAEAVLITGGTAVAGSASGTISFVPAFTHTGAWTIQSATTGIQEAVQTRIASGFGCVYLPAGIYTLYASVTWPTGQWACIGDGQGSDGVGVTNVRMDSSNSTADAFKIASNVFCASGFRMDYGGNQAGPWSTGIGFHFSVAGGTYHLRDINIYSFAAGVDSLGQHGYSSIDNVTLSAHDTGLKLRGGGGQFLNLNITVASAGTGIDVSPTQADRAMSGAMFKMIWIGGGRTGFQATTTIAAVNEVTIESMFIDTPTVASLQVTGQTFTAANWTVTNLFCRGASVGVALDASLSPGVIESWRLTNIYSFSHDIGILMYGGTGAIAWDNLNIKMDTDAHGVGMDCRAGGTGILNATFVGCSIGYAENGASTGARPITGVLFDSTIVDGLVFVGNSISASSTVWSMAAAAFTNCVISKNVGLDTVIGTVTIATGTATFSPFNLYQTLNSSAAVSAVAGLIKGQTVTFVNANATPGTWTAGATIGNTLTPVQNVPVIGVFDGTKIWLK